MKRLPLLVGTLISLCLSLVLLGLTSLVVTVASIPNPAFSLFDLVSRVLPGPVLTRGIDTMVSIIRGFNLGRTDTVAKLGEQLMAMTTLGVVSIVAGTVYFAIVQRLLESDSPTFERDSWLSGLSLGAIIGIALIAIFAAFDRSAASFRTLGMGWIAISSLAWGAAHGRLFSLWQAGGTLLGEPSAAPTTASASSYVPPMQRGGSAPTAVGSTAATSVEPAVSMINRRQFLVQLGGASALISVTGAGLSAWLNTSRTAAELGSTVANATPEAIVPDAAGFMIAPGTRKELTPIKDFYRIDIGSGGGPVIDEATYTLPIRGLVESDLMLTLDQIKALPKFDQILTQSCISNPVGGDLISTIKWTGTSMQDFLALVKPKPEATHIKISGADGFYEYLALDVIKNDQTVMLAYSFEDQPLPQRNGFPLRVHVPDRYGMKQPKWIIEMEFVSAWEPGYWVERGWSQEARVRATSVLDTVATSSTYTKDGKQYVPIGGIAWAGTRGISKVEVKVDDGQWEVAQLKQALSAKTWVLWRYDWAFTSGTHVFAVRCYEADGTMQIEAEADVRPDGATGLHRLTTLLS